MRYILQSYTGRLEYSSGELIWHDDMEDEIENCGMNISDKNQAEHAGENAEQLDLIRA